MLLTTTVCHPALANDNLSGIVVLAALARALAGRSLRHRYRLVWSPGTLGPLCWLHHNSERRRRHRARPRDLVRRGPRRHHLQAQPHEARRNRPRRGGRSPRQARRRDRRLVAVRRRRATVLLAGLRPAVRGVLALAGGCVPRVPLVRRRPRPSSRPRRSLTRTARCCQIIDVFERDGTYVNASPTASRSSVDGASTDRSGAARAARRRPSGS